MAAFNSAIFAADSVAAFAAGPAVAGLGFAVVVADLSFRPDFGLVGSRCSVGCVAET